MIFTAYESWPEWSRFSCWIWMIMTRKTSRPWPTFLWYQFSRFPFSFSDVPLVFAECYSESSSPLEMIHCRRIGRQEKEPDQAIRGEHQTARWNPCILISTIPGREHGLFSRYTFFNCSIFKPWFFQIYFFGSGLKIQNEILCVPVESLCISLIDWLICLHWLRIRPSSIDCLIVQNAIWVIISMVLLFASLQSVSSNHFLRILTSFSILLFSKVLCCGQGYG